ncbi:MAG: serine hydrolase [Gemmatimonadota bacterium]|nr:serine hydrolase [Gemmatimonadota bacterium]
MLTVLVAALALGVGGGGLPVKTPAAVGMSAKRLASIDRVVNRGITAGGYPGAAVVVGRKGAAVWQKGFGRLSWDTADEHVKADETIYDLASLTKVVGTTTAIMVLFDDGKIDLDAPVSRYLPDFQGEGKDAVTLRLLLEHRSGLPADRDLWRLPHDPTATKLSVLGTPLVCKPGDCYIYSDLGAITLGMVVEAISGEPLDVFLAERVYGPLRMNNTFFRPADSLKAHIAPTELTPPRGYPLRGEVHDENAYALGGIAGHAGLFSTAADLSIFAQMMLNGGVYNGTRVLSDSTIKYFTQRAAGSRALGWAMADGQWGSGRFLGDHSYGHVGYTGTSLWIDPDAQMFVVLLTNRVHAARAKRPAQVISDVRADLADLASLAVMDRGGEIAAMPAHFRADLARNWNRPERHKRRHHAKVSTRGKHGKAGSKAKASKSRTKAKSHVATKSGKRVAHR